MTYRLNLILEGSLEEFLEGRTGLVIHIIN